MPSIGHLRRGTRIALLLVVGGSFTASLVVGVLTDCRLIAKSDILNRLVLAGLYLPMAILFSAAVAMSLTTGVVYGGVVGRWLAYKHVAWCRQTQPVRFYLVTFLAAAMALLFLALLTATLVWGVP